MKKDWKYILFVSLIFGVYVFVQLNSKKPHNWFLTLDYTDKEPYGAFALHALLPSLFPGGVRVSPKTLYELKDSLKVEDNILILAREFDPQQEDLDVLLDLAEKGNSIFISAESYGKKIKDTLGITTSYNFFSFASFNQSDSLYVEFANPALHSGDALYFKTINLQNQFSYFREDSSFIFTTTEKEEIITVRMPWGNGNLLLNTTPAAFTNVYAVHGNDAFISKSFSALPPSKLVWLENYQVGHRELSTPLRYILTNDPLSWGYYLTIFSILFFMIFESKRKQRPIPVIKPLVNSSLEFTTTIGNLYYQRNDHKNIMEKRIHFFFDFVRTHFYLNGNEPDFAERLSKKSMKRLDQIQSLIKGIRSCLETNKLSVDELTELNKQFETFYKQS